MNPGKVARHVVRTPWMNAPATKRLFAMLQGNIPEDEPQALFVGGCVRNTVLDREVEDLDLATPLTPDEVSEILQNNDVKVIPTGLEHGTVTAIIEGRIFEITTLRKDEQTDGRRAVVSYTSSWREDAMRRDFTMNTLLMDIKGNIYDPLGCGLSDLDARHVVFVGEAKKRIEEDHLRILRFFRFSALYGKGHYDEKGLQASQHAANKIEKLSKERITQEFFKIIASDRPYDVLKVMFAHDVLKKIEFPDYNAEFLEHFCTFQSRYGVNALSSRLFVTASLNFENIKTMEEYIIFPKVFLKDMKAINGALNLPDLSCDHAVRESIYRFGRTITAQALIIELVQDRVMNGYAPKAFDIIQNWEIPIFPINGKDLMKAGAKQGPELGKKIQALEKWWVDQEFKPDRNMCLEHS